MIKILNLYACLGGNRYKWNEVSNNIEVTSIELDPHLAELYNQRFPNDNVIVADAHDFLLHNFKDFDFIWSSPPCPTHSRVRISQKNRSGFKPVFPSMSLYEEIIFLNNYFEGKYVVENVIPFYTPLIPGKKIGRHLFWSNMKLNGIKERNKGFRISEAHDEIKKLCKFHEIDISNYKGNQRKDKIARNLVDYEVGKQIFEIFINGKVSSSNNSIQSKFNF